MTAPLAVVGLVEIADMLKVERTTVRTWYHRGKLPVPDALLAATPVWRRSTVRKWARQFPLAPYYYDGLTQPYRAPGADWSEK